MATRWNLTGKNFQIVCCAVVSVATISLAWKFLISKNKHEISHKKVEYSLVQQEKLQNEECGQKQDKGPENSHKQNATDECGDCVSCEESPMLGTMKPYLRHVIICSGTEDFSVSHIEKEEGSFAQMLQECLIANKLVKNKEKKKDKNGKKKEKDVNEAVDSKADKAEEITKVKLTASSEKSLQEGKTDVLVYPEALRYQLMESDIEMFVQCQLAQGEICNALNPISIEYKHLILVCTHSLRDKRCGRAGPQVIERFCSVLEQKGIPETEVCVRASSHIGGHKYAGTLIVYPEGDCYGRISKRNAEELIEKYLAGQRWNKCWRGNMSQW